MKQSTQKKVITALAVLLALVIAAVACLAIAGVKGINPVCLFKHNYGDDGKCSRCGADKPAEESEPEAQSFVESYKMLATARLNSTRSSLYVLEVGKIIAENTELSISMKDELLTACKWTSFELFSVGSKTVYLFLYPSDEGVAYYNYSFTQTDLPQISNPVGYEPENDAIDYVERNIVFQIPFLGRYLALSGKVTDIVFKDIFVLEDRQSLPPSPQKTGYTFTGWYTDEACTDKYEEQYVTGDITLYAGFQVHTYTIKFNANSGSGAMDNLPMTYDQTKTLTANGFNKEHYAFKGWATSADGEVVYANSVEVNNLTAEDNATVELFAVWERSEVCVTFVSEGNTVSTTWIAIGTKATLPETPVKEGHLFNGWYYEDGTKYETQNISEDVTLTAKYSIIRCTVTFVVDGAVYAVYVCDWGTSIAQALNGAGVNTVLYKADEHSGNF